MKTKILMDSTSYATKENIDKYNIGIVPLYVNFEDISFKETMNYDNTEEILNIIKRTKTIPKSSQPSTQDFLNKFEEVVKDGYERIILFTISSTLSGTYQGAVLAANIFKEENKNIQIDVFDSGTVAQASSFGVMRVADVLSKKPNLSNEQIQKIMNWYANNIKIRISVDKIDYLIYGGRVNSAIGAIGNILGINPILKLEKGQILEHSKCRSRKKAIKEMISNIEKDINEEDGQYTVMIIHFSDQKSAKSLSKTLHSEFDSKAEILDGGSIGPVIGIHTGPGLIGVGWFKNATDEEILNS